MNNHFCCFKWKMREEREKQAVCLKHVRVTLIPHKNSFLWYAHTCTKLHKTLSLTIWKRQHKWVLWFSFLFVCVWGGFCCVTCVCVCVRKELVCLNWGRGIFFVWNPLPTLSLSFSFSHRKHFQQAPAPEKECKRHTHTQVCVSLALLTESIVFVSLFWIDTKGKRSLSSF